jgi:sulfoxide reductase heme-binding subunit YedZ
MQSKQKKIVEGTGRVLIHTLSALPLLWLMWAIPAGKLGGDPVEELIHFLGLGAIRLLLLSLTITPLAKLASFPLLNRWRRPLGVWAFVWATLHFSSWIAFDLAFSWGLIGEELVKRTYILLGFTVWLVLLAMAITSIPSLVKAMGKYWKTLHRLVYPCIVVACIHFWWSLKSGWLEPVIYLGIALWLLYFRRRYFSQWATRLRAPQSG